MKKQTPISDIPVDYFGCLEGTVTIKEDIIEPIDVEWNAAK